MKFRAVITFPGRGISKKDYTYTVTAETVKELLDDLATNYLTSMSVAKEITITKIEE